MTGAGLISPLCMTPGRGTVWDIHKSSSEPFSKMLLPPGKIHPQRQNFRLVYLDLPATSPLIDSCTRKYRDWTEGCLAPESGEGTALEEHFVWLSKDYTPYDNDPGSPFVPLDFMLGLPLVKDWPRHAGELPWVLDPKECPKSSRNVPVDSTSSMDEGKKKKKKKKKHCRYKKKGKPELKVTTRGEGADTPVWTCMAGLPKTLVRARILNPRVTVVWAPILQFNPVRILTPSPSGVLLPAQVQTTPSSP